MITSQQVWSAMTDEERYLHLMRAEDARDLFAVGHRTGPMEWGNLTPEGRYSRLTAVEMDKDNLQTHLLHQVVAQRDGGIPAAPRPQVNRLQSLHLDPRTA